MKCKETLALLCLVFAVLPASNARCEENEKERTIGLYSDDEKTVIEYLKNHRIPHSSGTPSGPGPDYPPYRREVERALELFEGGIPKLRLAIAKSLVIYNEEGMKFWGKCGPEDYEAKHYLVGVAFARAKPEQREGLREWLVNEAHPSYATTLLKNLTRRALFDKTNESQEKALIGILKELYKQKGRVVSLKWLPGDYERKDHAGPVQRYVLRLLPGSPASGKVLLEWICRDSKKVDETTLKAMWYAWGRSKLNDTEGLSERRDLAESWLLCPARARSLRHLDATAFKKNVCSQVFNPDPRVRTRALEYVIQGGARHPRGKDKADSNAGFDAIKAAFATKAMRARALEEAKAIYAELLEKNKKQASVTARLKEDFAKLTEALSP